MWQDGFNMFFFDSSCARCSNLTLLDPKTSWDVYGLSLTGPIGLPYLLILVRWISFQNNILHVRPTKPSFFFPGRGPSLDRFPEGYL
jgi:hypothetical protein